MFEKNAKVRPQDKAHKGLGRQIWVVAHYWEAAVRVPPEQRNQLAHVLHLEGTTINTPPAPLILLTHRSHTLHAVDTTHILLNTDNTTLTHYSLAKRWCLQGQT